MKVLRAYRRLRLPLRLLCAAGGAALGIWEVAQEDQAHWSATHASVVTRGVELLGGALLGAAMVSFAVVLYANLWFGADPVERRPMRVSPSPVQPQLRPPQSRPRQVILLVFAVVLFGAGGEMLAVSVEHPTIYGLLRGGGIGVVLLGLGSYLLWDDFVAPMISRRDRR